VGLAGIFNRFSPTVSITDGSGTATTTLLFFLVVDAPPPEFITINAEFLGDGTFLASECNFRYDACQGIIVCMTTPTPSPSPTPTPPLGR